MDPLSDEFPAWSPQAYSYNDPTKFIDPKGIAPDPPEVGVGFWLRLHDSHAEWTFRTNANISVSSDLGAAQLALAVGGSVYNGGLGTASASTGNTSLQGDLTLSAAVSLQGGEGGVLPIHPLSGSTPSGLVDDSQNSATLATTGVFNSSGRNQRVGTLRGQFGGVAVSTHNDLFPEVGDGDDRFNTGGGSVALNQGSGTVTVGNDVSTRDAPTKRAGNTINGYWDQTPSQQSLNNGRTYVRTLGVGPATTSQRTGAANLATQDFIHLNISNSPLFDSGAVNP